MGRDAILMPGDLILLMSWRTRANTEALKIRSICRRMRGSAASESCATVECLIGARRRNTVPRSRAHDWPARIPVNLGKS
jgi:hypothetical protein